MAGKPVRSRAGVFSRASAVRAPDGRTREARIIKQTVADLAEHVGGQPPAPQRLPIDASAILVLRLHCRWRSPAAWFFRLLTRSVNAVLGCS
jgi:hypothetical protein